MNWIPDRKVIGGGIGMILGWLAVQGLAALGVELDLEDQGGVMAAVAGFLAWATPTSVKDVLRKGDTFLKLVLKNVNNDKAGGQTSPSERSEGSGGV